MKNKKESIFSYKITYFIIALVLFLMPWIIKILSQNIAVYMRSKVVFDESICTSIYDQTMFPAIITYTSDIIFLVIHFGRIVLPIVAIIFGIVHTSKNKNTIRKKDDKKTILKITIPFLILLIIYGIKVYFIEYYYSQCYKTVAKPILYIYPKEDVNVKVTLNKKENLLTTYPKYNNGWEVLVKQNGDMYDKDGKYYYALYWDEKNNNTNNFEEGFYVTKENAIDFLEEKLTYIGLNDKEKNEFIMYWLPIIEKNEKNIINFELTEELQRKNKITITPKPDSFLRVHINIKKVDKKVNIKNQKLKPFNRTEYTAVEWGGTNY